MCLIRDWGSSGDIRNLSIERHSFGQLICDPTKQDAQRQLHRFKRPFLDSARNPRGNGTSKVLKYEFGTVLAASSLSRLELEVQT